MPQFYCFNALVREDNKQKVEFNKHVLTLGPKKKQKQEAIKRLFFFKILSSYHGKTQGTRE